MLDTLHGIRATNIMQTYIRKCKIIFLFVTHFALLATIRELPRTRVCKFRIFYTHMENIGIMNIREVLKFNITFLEIKILKVEPLKPVM